MEVAKKFGMTGIGVKQSGPAGKRFIHLDNLGSNYTKLTGGPSQTPSINLSILVNYPTKSEKIVFKDFEIGVL